jgi:hypothetical protein
LREVLGTQIRLRRQKPWPASTARQARCNLPR